MAGKFGTLAVALFFIVIGGASAGGTGVALLPIYWQRIGALLPPRYAVDLYRNVRYFDGNNIGVPIAVLVAYAAASVVVILLVQRRRSAGDAAAGAGAAEAESPGRRRLVAKNLVAPVAFRSCSPHCSR